IAQRALLRGTGARGLKSIIEDVLLNSMFDVPSHPEIKRCVITEQAVTEGIEPLMITEEPKLEAGNAPAQQESA
ncbi:MAG TPA: ATP-dependent Clp protease ATP-binding subunit ClpX, partial [Candidatus Dormibacteraeota bacterium]|nr:ATP-dependent Clp protease ATP-binding subunit ClpX [Candidatus Dormibacteraeota bacterium]